MLRTLSFALTLLPLSALSLDAHAGTKAIRFARLWDGHRLIGNATVIVENDRVQRVIVGDELPTRAEVIDLRATPAFRTHITYYWDGAPDTTPRRQPPRHVAVTVFLAQENAKKRLRRA